MTLRPKEVAALTLISIPTSLIDAWISGAFFQAGNTADLTTVLDVYGTHRFEHSRAGIFHPRHLGMMVYIKTS